MWPLRAHCLPHAGTDVDLALYPQDKCAQAMSDAAKRAAGVQKKKLPKGVWWGFHYFWPRDVLQVRTSSLLSFSVLD